MGLQNLPSVDEILREPEMIELCKVCTRAMVADAVRDELGLMRGLLIKNDRELDRQKARKVVVGAVCQRIRMLQGGTLKRVINGTGVVLHTNLGRAPLAHDVVALSNDLVCGYTNLELDLDAGKRGSRYQHLESMLQKITGAEAALVVNNNAAAVMLVLNTLARDREVVVSRGQLVEIGGSFRIPEIMALSGAHLVEVGTTNKTYIRDFDEAVSENTGLLLAVHTSNYRIVGFTSEVETGELVELGHNQHIPVVQDLGSGSLIDLSPWGLTAEPTVQQCIQDGVDVVTFSGDKLLGGPQAGIIAGKRKYIDQMKKNHLLRALRVDKMTIAALEATLRHYVKGDAVESIPVLEMLTRSEELLHKQAENLGSSIRTALGGIGESIEVRVIDLTDKVGGGAYPLQELTGFGVELTFNFDAEMVARKLREQEPALLARIHEGSLIVSVRTLLSEDMEIVPALLRGAVEEKLT